MSMFTNGNNRIRRLVIFELLCGVFIMVSGQILGTLPSQDWLDPKHIKIASFALGTFLTIVKGLEMFFSKTVAMFKNHEFDTDHIENPKPPPPPP